MNNSIEFILRLKNMMGGELTRVGSAAHNAFTRMQRNVDAVTGRNRVLGMTFNELQRQITQTENTIRNSNIPSQIAFARRELASLQRQANQHQGNLSRGSGGGGSGLGIQGVAIGSMIGNAYTKALSMITQGAGEIVQGAFAKESAMTGLTTFLGKEGAKSAYGNIEKDAINTNFDTQSLLMVNRSLLAAGETAEGARKVTMDLANAITAVGGGNDELTRMAVNLQQIKVMGKATALDIKQFGYAGINIYEMLAKSTGKSVQQVREMEVTYEQLQAALAMSSGKGGMYEGATEAQSQTTGAQYAKMMETFKKTGVDLFMAFAPVINKIFQFGTSLATSLTPVVEYLTPYITAMGVGFDYILNIVTGVSTATGGWADWINIIKSNVMITFNFFKNVGLILFQMVGSIMEFVKNSEILKDVFRFVLWVGEKILNVITYMLNVIKWIWDNVVGPLLTAIDSAYKMVKDFFSDEKEVTVKVKKTSIRPQIGTDVIAQTATQSATNTTASKSAGESVVGGGAKTINISVGKFFDNIQFTTMNGEESAEQLEKVVLEALARVLYNGSKLT
jgi:tape measure domain-containing protein